MKSQGARIGSVSVLLFFGWVLARADLPRTRVDFSRGEKLLHLREGTHGIVAVTERGPSRRLKLNNYYVLGGTSATGDERLQGHIPFLLHPEARSAAFLGYGTGISAGSAMFHPVTNVLALELVPEVAEVAAAYFAEPNARFASRHPVIIEDARNYLRGSTNQFDLIIGDLVVPWRHGEGALYTLEHFQAARARLAPSGVYCCWLPMFQLGRADFEVILRTFLQVFPSAQIWRGDFSPTEPALALVSLPPDHVVDLRLDRMQADPSNAQLKFPSAFWMHYVGSITNIAPGHLNTQDRQLLELRSVRAKPFVGRALAQWERELTAQSLSLMENRLTNEGRAGVSAGELMREFTLLLSENRRNEAEAVAQRIRAVLGDEAAQTVLGP